MKFKYISKLSCLITRFSWKINYYFKEAIMKLYSLDNVSSNAAQKSKAIKKIAQELERLAKKMFKLA